MTSTGLANAGFLAMITTVGGLLLAIAKFFYSTVKERILEIRSDRDYWREKYMAEYMEGHARPPHPPSDERSV